MIIEYIKDTFENIRERIKNPFSERNKTPFAGAFLIAIIIYNWELFYSLFNFESWISRENKILIIKQYLNEKKWYERIGWPLSISFLSIFFYYTFNYISLGISTFFRRWFKGLILYYTDKSQIIPREEHETFSRKALALKTKNDILKESSSKLEDEKENLLSQLTELTSQFSKLKSEKEELENKVPKKRSDSELIKEKIEEIKIIYSHYGAGNSFYDVTEIVSKLVKNKSKILINNKTFGQDPLTYSVKSLIIIYEVNEKREKLIANEEEEIEVKGNKLIVHKTENSKLKLNYIKNEEILWNIFKGDWKLTSVKNGKNYQENVKIDEFGNYYSNNKQTFFIKRIQINEKTKNIKFDKITLERTLHSQENLEILNNDRIKGVDSLGFSLEYERIN